ncbi:glutathione S-transferase family protein [Cupriavidus sp. IDO]|uniref:glutathione S-transferase family protein n=1 Tax=Cupriavidus sp. IDO TaxID=1539142 RepID=UPI0005795FD9|nr:glutathione S-transferase family protein [Cupriavidus sp. IDO]KWR86824.1 glutathione S-transferase [Cupriavidus sp. IDO]
MYEVYAFSTPNSVKVPIALEELGVPYELHAVNVRQGEQKRDSFLALNANGKVPVITDLERAFVLSESAAILVYLAEKHGELLSHDSITRARTFEQLFVHASGLSPAFGQAGYFQKFAPERIPHAVERFVTEANRQLRLLDGVLDEREFAAGDAFSIADIAHFGWIWRRGFPDLTLDDFPNVRRWYDAVQRRQAVVRAISKVEGLVPLAA